MGVLSAMNNAVAGLSAQSFALENISGNIANSQTTAFKRTDTLFSDLVVDTSTSVANTTAGSVMANSRLTAGLAGDTTASDVGTNMSIGNSGYFQVTTASDNDTLLYTRRGDFAPDSEGYLINGSGYYLQGYAITQNADGEDVIGTSLSPIQITPNSSAASATSTITYTANLPVTPSTTTSQTDGGSHLYTASDYTTVADADEDSFLNQTVSGGSVTVYDAQGTAHQLNLRWAKIADADSTAGTNDEWALYYQNDTGTADPAWTQISSGASNGTVDGSFTFTSAGQPVETLDALSIADLTIGGTNLGTVTGSMNLTQFANTAGTVTNTLSQNGYAAGTYKSMSIGDDGVVSYTYSNGQVVDVWQVPLVSFNNDSGLKAMDGGAYAATQESGNPSQTDSVVTGSAIETSNVDISEEFTKMIVTQQAYSANSKVITTANQMMDDLLNLIR